MFVICYLELQKFNFTVSLLTKSLMRWNLTLMCLFQPYKTEFLDNWIIELMSKKLCAFVFRSSNLLQNSSKRKICFKILQNEMHWQTNNYSAFVVERLRTDCSFDVHEIDPNPIMNTYTEVLFRSYKSPTYLLYVKDSRPIFLPPFLYSISKSVVPFMYLKILFTASQWDDFR